MAHRVALRRAAGAIAALLAASTAVAQSWHLDAETRLTTASWRGFELDSVRVTATLPGPGGGRATVDGFAATCRAGRDYCTFYRPTDRSSSTPFVQTFRINAWDLGVRGVQFRASTRISDDLSSSATWPLTAPALQLVEGYAEYSSSRITARAGRTWHVSRFGYTGIDGASVELRPLGQTLAAGGYAGWGLARGASLPVNSDELNPLLDFQLSDRQIVAGAHATLRSAWGSATAQYQRQVDPFTDSYLSERAGIDARVRVRGVGLRAGADYDLAQGQWGRVDGALNAWVPWLSANVELGARRYRPHFELWTIWPVFSPVPYTALFAATEATILGTRLSASGEVFQYDDAGALTPLVNSENAGHRWSVTVAREFRDGLVSGRARYFAEEGPGAAGDGAEVAVHWRAMDAVAVETNGGLLERVQEFRFGSTRFAWVGARIRWELRNEMSFVLGTTWQTEELARADAAGADHSWLRVEAGMRVSFDSRRRHAPATPVIDRIPEGRRP